MTSDMKALRAGLIVAISFIPVLILFACSGSNRPTDSEEESIIKIPLEVHLQSGFDKNRVRVEIHTGFSEFVNGEANAWIGVTPLFNEVVTTFPALGLAEIVRTTMESGQHSIKVVVEDSIEVQSVFDLQDTLFIGVNYVSGSELTLNFSEDQFMYD